MMDRTNSGKRVEFVSSNDPHTRLVPGTQGTILYSRDDGFSETISVKWDDGSSLSMIPSEGDRIRMLD